MNEQGWVIVLGLILLSVVAFLLGYIPAKRAANKERRQVNAVKEALCNTASPKWGPEIPNTTQVRPGLYRVNLPPRYLK